MTDIYKVRYLKHNFFKDCESIETEVTKAELIDLLSNGMITVKDATHIFDYEQFKKTLKHD